MPAPNNHNQENRTGLGVQVAPLIVVLAHRNNLQTRKRNNRLL